ncbi:MAG TPA: ABC transporter ATP-binding protein [Candidatus Limiplasma sp.]|nr:ABC transporter ATP-binding protein [Candidatus Limiplasma sp.]HPR78699.1 ABC transporter ATP-binding protein [Candidatus Limiplasma sp.]
MAEVLLEVKDLKTYFPTRDELVKAVDGVSFCVYKGETFGLVGESGCGKSQTCRSILGLLKKPGRVVNGQILLNGQNLVGLMERELRKYRGKQMSVIFQEPMTSLSPVMKIKKQIMEIYDDQPMTRKEKKQKAIDLLRMVGIPSPETRVEEYTHQFSGGMRQRAMIAMALGAKPKLLIADEPTTALDVTIQDQIMKLINELKQEMDMSVILVTHDLGVIAQMCDRVAVMYAGLIMEMCDVVTLFAHPRHPYTYGLMRSLPDPAVKGGKLTAIAGSPPNLAHLPEGCPFAPRCTLCGEICKKQRPELVEIAPGHAVRCHFAAKTAAYQGIITVPGEEA